VKTLKHKYRILAVGESYETPADPPRWLRTGVYRYGSLFDKKFSVTKVTPRDPNSALLIRRTA
jgi:hypothetical protein